MTSRAPVSSTSGSCAARTPIARITRVDAKAARAIRGVLAAWTAADLPQLAQPLVTASGGAHKERPFVVPLLAGERARYVGEPVAVVVAESPALVADALAAVGVEYAPLPPLVGAARRGGRRRACTRTGRTTSRSPCVAPSARSISRGRASPWCASGSGISGWPRCRSSAAACSRSTTRRPGC